MNETLVLFKLMENNFSLPSSSILEIIRKTTITPLTNSPPYYVGTTSIRGEILPVINLNTFFSIGSENSFLSDSGKDREHILVNQEKISVLLQIDRILGTIIKPKEELTTEIFNNMSQLNSDFFNNAFLHKNQIVVGIDLMKVLETIRKDVEELHQLFKEENRPLLTPIELSNNQMDLNIPYQQQIITSSGSFSEIKKSVNEVSKAKSSGILVLINDVEILIPDNRIIEIYSTTSIEKVPNSEKFVSGAINFRGRIISVLNLPELLVSPSQRNEDLPLQKMSDQIVIIEESNQIFALQVNKIKGTFEYEKSEVRSSYTFRKGTYLFQGAIIAQNDKNIILLLNVEYLIREVINSKFLDQLSNQLVFFTNPVIDTYSHYSDVDKEGLLITIDDDLFFLDTTYVIQILGPSSFLFKNYSTKVIRGAAAFKEVVPLIDLRSILKRNDSKVANFDESTGILTRDPESQIEIAFLVDRIDGRMTYDAFDTVETSLRFSKEVIPPIFSGFFSFQGKLGVIIDTHLLIEEAAEAVKSDLKLKDLNKEFIATLLPEEMNDLSERLARQREFETLLTLSQRKNRIDFFIFRWRNLFLAIEVSFVRRVFVTVKIQDIDQKSYPILGYADIDDEKVPFLDLQSYMLSSEQIIRSKDNGFYFSLDYEGQLFLIQADQIDGVTFSFVEDFKPMEDSSFFKKDNNACSNTFSVENLSSSIMILNNEFLMNTLGEMKNYDFVKNLSTQTNNKKE